MDSSTPTETTPSKTPPSKMTVLATSQPSQQVPSNIIENENLAWKRFQKAITDEDINVCYDMSLKDFEHFGVHDLFKVNNCLCLVFAILKCFFLFFSFFILTIYSLPFCKVCQSLLQRLDRP